jgi:hypothetical protein
MLMCSGFVYMNFTKQYEKKIAGTIVTNKETVFLFLKMVK